MAHPSPCFFIHPAQIPLSWICNRLYVLEEDILKLQEQGTEAKRLKKIDVICKVYPRNKAFPSDSILLLRFVYYLYVHACMFVCARAHHMHTGTVRGLKWELKAIVNCLM